MMTTWPLAAGGFTGVVGGVHLPESAAPRLAQLADEWAAVAAPDDPPELAVELLPPELQADSATPAEMAAESRISPRLRLIRRVVVIVVLLRGPPKPA